MSKNLNRLFNLIITRLTKGILTIPAPDNWFITVIMLVFYSLIALPIGLYFGFLKFGWAQLTLGDFFTVVGICLFAPAITEELFFRVLLLPHITEEVTKIRKMLWGCISLAIFIVYHPLNALTAYPAGNPTFMNVIFLFQAGVLGIICTVAYLQSGSLWPSVIMHWIIVVVWLVLFGGYEKLST
ncbi:abortive infection protein [Nostoc sp. HK-01]|nr:abortive infection protein [Nostoc sp. HK-01]